MSAIEDDVRDVIRWRPQASDESLSSDYASLVDWRGGVNSANVTIGSRASQVSIRGSEAVGIAVVGPTSAAAIRAASNYTYSIVDPYEVAVDSTVLARGNVVLTAGSDWVDLNPAPLLHDPIYQFASEKVRRAHDAVNQISSQLPRDAERLHSLVDMAADDFPSTDIPTPTAIVSFRDAMHALHPVRKPSISLTSGGTIWCEWSDGGKRAALSIRADGRAAFGMIVPNPVKPWIQTRTDYTGDLTAVIDKIAGDRTSKWLQET